MSDKIVTLTTNNFEEEVKKAAPILVDFWAEWCGPCRMVAPVLERLAEQYEGKARVGKVNVDDQKALATQFGILSIPALLLFKEGQVVEQLNGATTQDVLAKLIDKHV